MTSTPDSSPFSTIYINEAALTSAPDSSPYSTM